MGMCNESKVLFGVVVSHSDLCQVFDEKDENNTQDYKSTSYYTKLEGIVKKYQCIDMFEVSSAEDYKDESEELMICFSIYSKSVDMWGGGYGRTSSIECFHDVMSSINDSSIQLNDLCRELGIPSKLSMVIINQRG